MNLEKVIITVKECRTYQIVMSTENGYDMPKSSQELVELSIEIGNGIDLKDYDNREMFEDSFKVENVEYIDKN